MTFPRLLVAPSIWMQKTFFQLAEAERGVKIGEENEKEGLRTKITLRVMAVAHAVLQTAYALISVVPLCIATIGTILFTKAETGFLTQGGGRLERLALGVAAAVASVFAPVVSSIGILIDIQKLDDQLSLPIYLPPLAHGYLLSFTLPSLDLIQNKYFEQKARTEFGELIEDDRTFREKMSRFVDQSEIAKCADPTSRIRLALSVSDKECFNWRKILPFAFRAGIANEGIAAYDTVLDPSSELFSSSLTAALDETRI